MRPYKRATMIARAIIKMIEDSGGGLAEIAKTAVLLPAITSTTCCRTGPRMPKIPPSG
jgi:hypothetical protein